MADITFEEVLKFVEALSPAEQDELIEHLRAKRTSPKRPPLNFPVDDLGEWTEGISLRREDWYGDDGR